MVLRVIFELGIYRLRS